MPSLAEDVHAIFTAALAAVDPERLVRESLSADPGGLYRDGRRLFVAAAGKAAVAMTRGALAACGDAIEKGVVVAPAGDAGELPSRFQAHRGGHPLPDAAGVDGARAIRDLAASLGEDDVLLCLLSGGGSALTTLPADGLELDDLRATTHTLLRAGAEIGQLNAVRKHLEALKGGRLAALAAPARVEALVLSDVLGDRLDVIASGPLSPDPTTFAAARAVLAVAEARGAAFPPAVLRHLERGVAGELAETPKNGDPAFARVTIQVVGGNRQASAAAVAAASRRGYRALLLTRFLSGEAREIGNVLAALARQVRADGAPLAPPACLVLAGETTVTVRGSGRGGRNQEVALGAALALAESELEGDVDVMVASLGTDGIDGPTDAAGAVARGDTVRRATVRGLDARRALADNDAYPFFDALGDLVKMGPTGTNVMDLMLVLVR